MLAGALAAAGVLCLGVAALLGMTVGDTPSAATTLPSLPPVEQTAPVVTARPVDVSGAATQPAPASVSAQWVRIEDLGVRSPLVGLGLQDDGTVEVPADPDLAGWFELGTVPGRVGSAVVLGHVDSVDGPAVFARLGQAARGARVEVGLSDGGVEAFRVRAVRTYANADFPADKVYRSHGKRLLNLVTCGGSYDAARGGYQANVVVYARRVARR